MARSLVEGGNACGVQNHWSLKSRLDNCASSRRRQQSRRLLLINHQSGRKNGPRQTIQYFLARPRKSRRRHRLVGRPDKRTASWSAGHHKPPASLFYSLTRLRPARRRSIGLQQHQQTERKRRTTNSLGRMHCRMQR